MLGEDVRWRGYGEAGEGMQIATGGRMLGHGVFYRVQSAPRTVIPLPWRAAGVCVSVLSLLKPLLASAAA